MLHREIKETATTTKIYKNEFYLQLNLFVTKRSRLTQC